ncbi:MAG: rhodanese-like domain-containing protein [Hyphomicrobiales bacterium]
MELLLNLLTIFIISTSSISSVFAAEFMSVTKANQQSKSGNLLLVDIRRPSEWKQTGVAKNAAKISMHQKGFLDHIARHTKGNKTAPVALICAHGIRSTHMIRILEKNGYSNVYNVKEGMLGSKEGPGWIAKGLPLQ